MNNINGINGYGHISALGAKNSLGNTRNHARPQNAAQGQDQVEISSVAKYLNKVSAIPDIRTEKVEEIRQQIAAGTYDVDGKLSEALDNMLEEYFG